MRVMQRFTCLLVSLALSMMAACSAKVDPEVADPGDGKSMVSYAISIKDVDGQLAEIVAKFPVTGDQTVLYMPVWTPGYYVKEDYKKNVVELRAYDGNGRELVVNDPGGNRWLVDTPAVDELVVRYVLSAKERSVSKNEIAASYAVFNGSATYIAAKGGESLSQEVSLSLPAGWIGATGLKETGAEGSARFLAENYEELVDSPIMVGDLEVVEFDSLGTPHYLVYNRGAVAVDNDKVVADLKTVVDVTRAFWSGEPWRKYVFLIAFRHSGGGLEHMHSTMVNVNPERFSTPAGYDAFVSLLSHEYQHAFNVKRLRPFELGPFDYENTPVVSTLWISEGLTSYYSNLMMRRSGVIGVDDYLDVLSKQITGLQNSPGRLKQSVEDSSLGVWSNSNSGIGASDETVSYYIKGEVAGFLLDAHIRKLSNGGKSLDDVVRAAYEKYSGDTGFRPEEFSVVAEKVVGMPLAPWFSSVIASASEVDYAEALDWYGLKLDEVGANGAKKWTLSVAESANEEQKKRLRNWLDADQH